VVWTSDDLVTGIRRRAHLDTANGDWTTTTLLAMADQEIVELFIPRLAAVREDYLVDYADFTITANQQAYRIPIRALNGVLRDVTVIDTSNYGRSLPLIPLEEVDYYNGLVGSSSVDVRGFALQGNTLLLLPSPSATGGTLRMRYLRRPGLLVATSSAQAITAINGARTQLTFASNSFGGTSTLDIIQAKPGFDTLGKDLVPSGSSGTTVTFSSAVSSDVAVGDYVVTQYYSPVPQLPAELHPLLEQAVAMRVAEILGDETLAAQTSRFQDSLEHVIDAMTPRVQGEARVVVNRNSFLRSRYRTALRTW